MDSSPDLSLKLRRGSNDSRDSYYMDFAQGIDSDIEEVASVIASAPPQPPPAVPPSTLAITTEDNTTTDDEQSPTTPMPMPLLPPISIPSSIMPKIPLVDEGWVYIIHFISHSSPPPLIQHRPWDDVHTTQRGPIKLHTKVSII